ncbi:Aldos-2-ulose dehydratase [Escovopsis weberi]|uniref:Aldos-2-ulose dehydratase n=1 Tax=Escovopsis weberi TaxID=150374 RepID=A0A0M8N8K8_ESCWE|nr:Aldos-2-ulose dehydratase [Escovopsis weberi]
MASKVLEPSFVESVIEPDRKDGSGLATGTVAFLDNPVATGGTVDQDIAGNGLSDVIVCHTYGPHMLRCDMSGGIVSWFKNPGRDAPKDTPWQQFYVGQWPSMHRLKVGYFTQTAYLEIIGAPILRGEHDQVVLKFQKPSKVEDASEWPRATIDDVHFTVIHEITVKKYDGPDGLDSIIVSSREGLTRLFWKEGEWKTEHIGDGEPREPRQSASAEEPGSGDYWGCGTSDVGHFAGDPFAYIATVDPFHGTTVAVYTKEYDSLKNFAWKRTVLDVYGTPEQRLKHGEGPAHYVVCADFDGDGNDEFLVSLFGPVSYDDNGQIVNGVYYYKPLDLEFKTFAKWKVTDTSSARIAVGDFRNSGLLDFVSISYNVPNYYEEPNPETRLFTNGFAPAPSPYQSIFPSFWAGEGLIRIKTPGLYPKGTPISQELPLIQVANVAISVQVVGKNETVTIPQGVGVKVLWGSLDILDKDGKTQDTREALNLVWANTKMTTSTYETAKASADQGAIFLWLKPLSAAQGGGTTVWADAGSVPVTTTLDLSAQNLQPPIYGFTMVGDLPWGGNFVGVNFWNMPGFIFRLWETDTPIAHNQFWVAGNKVDCGIHNHRYDLFGETHICLSNGTKDGGMWAVKDEPDGMTIEEAKALPPTGFEIRALKPLEEQGGMWERDSCDKAVKRPDGTLEYPWHKWQAGGAASNVDVWMALEFDAKLC